MASKTSETRVLITFDVDGTLMRAVGVDSNKLHKDAFSYAFKQVFGVDGTIDAIEHHGSTDPTVATQTLEHYGIPAETVTPKIALVKERMLEYAEQNADRVGEGLELLPGVLELMQRLAGHPDAVVGLVTGNLEGIGWLKMKGLGLLPYFSTPRIGGFGSDHTNRGELVKIAARRAEASFPGAVFVTRVHVGDTPNDLLAAQFGGALPLGVCTGVFAEEALKAVPVSDAVILPNLLDTSSFLKLCGLSH